MARIVPVQSIPASDYIGCKIKPLTCDFRGPTGIDPRPSVVSSVCEVCVCCSLCQLLLDQARLPLLPDDTKVFKEIISTSDAEQLQEDLSELGHVVRFC